MKKITSLLLLFVSTVFYAQSSGITYQAIIYNPNGEVIPGYNNENSPLANKNVCLQFSIIDAASLTEYQEKITTTTDEFGMVNLIIGTGIQTGGYATSFSNIYWSVTQKSLKVALDSNGQCSNFLEISNQPFTSVPFAFAANSAENVTGVVPIENGGTNAITVLGAKTNLGLQNVDNTRDLDKPISTATQTALNLKENLANKSNSISTDGTSTIKYPTVKSVKDYVDVSVNLGGAALTNEAIIRAAADAVLTNNLAAEVTNRTNADTTLTNNLAAEVTNRTNADLLKEDLINKSSNVVTDGESTTKYPTVKAIKTYVDASATATSNALSAETAARIAADNILTANIAAEVNRATATDNTLTSNLLSEFIRATSAENTLTSNLAAEVTNRTNADTTLQSNINTLGSTVTGNAATAAAATALKENSANKSIDVTLADATNVKFPTELAVKTFVTGQIGTSNTATNTAIAAVQADVDANETASNSADVTLQTNINTLGSTVTANAATAAAATALKENSANKSIDVTLADTSNVKFPTELAVKTYVNNQITTANATNANLTGMVTSNGNTTTVVTNANLTGAITSTGNATTLGSFTSSNIATALTDETGTGSVVLSTAPTLVTPVLGVATATSVNGTTIPTSKTLVVTTDKLNVLTATTSAELAGVISDETGTGTFVLSASPTFTGTPTLPTGTIGVTQTSGNSTTALATTAFVAAANATNANLTGMVTSNGNTTTVVTNANLTGMVTSNGNTTTVVTNANLTGPITSSGNATAIANGAITNAMLANGAVANLTGTNSGDQTNILGNAATVTTNANLTGMVTSNGNTTTVVTNANLTGVVTSTGNATAIADGAITNAMLANSAVANLTGTNSGDQTNILGNAATATTADNVSGVVAVANGGTGSSSQNFVDLTTDQTVAGAKTFSSDLSVNGLTIGLGSGSIVSNTANGFKVLYSNTTGIQNTASGMNALRRNINGVNNTVSGMNALTYNTNGSNNSAFGQGTLYNNIGGQRNTANGGSSLYNNTSGNYNTASGFQALYTNATGSYNTAIGNGADVSVDGLTNSTAIGNGAIVAANNTIQLGNSSVTAVNTSGSITGASFIKSGGTSSQFLKADGTVDSSTYLTSAGTAANVSGVVALVNGGTGSATQNFVDLTTDQTVAGAKTFSSDLSVNGLTIGLGAGSIVSNTANGFKVLYSNTTGIQNTASGMNALRRNINGVNNTVSGMNALTYNTNGSNNSAFGQGTLYNNIGGQRNTANGGSSLYNNTSGNYNTASGFQALYTNATGSYNTAIGNGADVSVDGLTNSTAIGNSAIVAADNTIQLGNSSVTSVNTSGALTTGAITYPNITGTANQVLTTDGNGVASWATPTSISIGSINGTSTANGATITSGVLSLAPADATNGGIVTTSAQTFSGQKTILGDLNVSGVLSGSNLDQSFTNFQGIVPFSEYGYTQFGQVFTAGITGYLSSISFQIGGTGTGTLKIYSGQGTSGTVLSSQPFSVTNGSVDLLNFPISSLVPVTSGSVYTIIFDFIGGQSLISTIANSSFPGGGAFYGGGIQSSQSLGFQTFVSNSYNGGNIMTSGTLTTGTITYPNTSGTANQVLITNGSGVASWASPSTTATAYSGTLPVSNGGTGLTSITSGQIPFGNGTSAIASSSNLTWNNSTGSLGVGTSTLDNDFNTNLDVVGRASFRTNGTNSGLIFDGYSPSGSLEVSRIYTEATTGTPSDFVLGTYPNGHLNQLYLKQSNGFVGIKTESPTTALEVNGTVKATSFLKSGGSASQFLKADGTVDTSTYLTSAGTAANVSGVVAVANGGTGSSSQNFVDLTNDQTVAGNKTFTGRIFGKTAFLNGGDGTFGNAFLVSNNDSGFLASYNSLGTIRTGFLGFSSGNSVVLKAEETNSLILGSGNQNTLTLGADQKATFAGGAVINGQTDINGSLFAANGTFSQRVTGKTAFLNGGDGTFGNAFLVSNNDSGFLASYNSLGTIRTGFLGFSSGNSVVLKAEETNSLILGAGNQNTLTLGADQKATFTGNVTATSFIKSEGTASQFLKADGSVDSTTYLTSAGTATNVSGVVAVDNGGTGQTTIAGIQGALGLTGTNVAIGYVAGYQNQGSNALAIGSNAAQSFQGAEAVAIGYAAGQNGQGAYSVAVGSFAGNSQVANSIAINATGAVLNPSNAGFYVAPIRSASGSSSLFYDATTKEITYGSSPSVSLTSSVTDILPLANGGTGSATKNFVDLTEGQTISGNKTFSSNATFNGQRIGKGNATGGENLAVGAGAMNGASTGVRNTAIGNSAMQNYVGTGFDNNTSLGYSNMVSLTTGSGNTSVGAESMMSLLTGTANTSVGNQSLIGTTGSNNVGIGKSAGSTITTGNNNTIIGTNANVGTNNLTNASALGFGATVSASNSIQLGNASVTAVNTSGALTTGTVKYPNTHNSTAGQVLTTNASGVASWATPTSGVPYTGATGVVDLGVYDLNLQSLTVGLGGGAVLGNTAFGNQALISNQATAYNNSAVGIYTLWSNTTGLNNTGLGAQAGRYNQTGTSNTSIGSFAMHFSTGSGFNTAVGVEALYSTTTGFNNTAIGFQSLSSNTTGTNNTALGFEADVASAALTNATAIGKGAIVAASNTIQLGNTSVTNVKTSGTLTAGTITYPNTFGSANQVLTTDGSEVASWATPTSVSEADDQIIATTAAQTSFTLTQTPRALSKVKMYVNGIRINKLAYSVSGTTLTYDPANNGAYAISINDRVQFEYTY